MRGEPVQHKGLATFLGRQYGHDESGRYFVQNGPQRVFVELEYTPWILHLDSQGALETHTGESAGQIHSAILDEEGNFLLKNDIGIALLCDRDLPALLPRLCDTNGSIADDATVLAFIEQTSANQYLSLHWQGQKIPVEFLPCKQIPRHFGYVTAPAPAMPAITG